MLLIMITNIFVVCKKGNILFDMINGIKKETAHISRQFLSCLLAGVVRIGLTL